MGPPHSETPPEGGAHRTHPNELHGDLTRLKGLRLIGLPSSLEGCPDLIAAWVRSGGTKRQHIVGYVNEEGHLPPWAIRQLEAEWERHAA